MSCMYYLLVTRVTTPGLGNRNGHQIIEILLSFIEIYATIFQNFYEKWKILYNGEFTYGGLL